VKCVYKKLKKMQGKDMRFPKFRRNFRIFIYEKKPGYHSERIILKRAGAAVIDRELKFQKVID
jgi:hypothetical protein